MKKDKLFKTGGVYLALIAFVSLSLTSCLKDSGPGSVDFSKSPALVGYQFTGGSESAYTAAVLPLAAQTYTTIEVTLSVASITLNSAVTVNIAESPADIPDGYKELPSSDYTLSNSGVVVINAGQQIVKFPIVFQGDKIDFTQNYALALKIKSANGATIASNLNLAVVKIKLKSVYEDIYDVKSGNTTRYNGATVASGVRDIFQVTESAINLATVDATSISGQIGSSSFGLTALYTINGSTVTVSADPNGTIGTNTFNYLQGNANGASSYNPATKELIIHSGYLNASGALRTVDMDLIGE